jgi:hypothetical protein
MIAIATTNAAPVQEAQMQPQCSTTRAASNAANARAANANAHGADAAYETAVEAADTLNAAKAADAADHMLMQHEFCCAGLVERNWL